MIVLSIPVIIIFILVSSFVKEFGIPKTGLYIDYIIFSLLTYGCLKVCGVL